MRKWIVGGAIALAVGGLVWVNIARLRAAPATAQGNGASGGPLVKVAKVEKRAITQKVAAPATLEASGVLEIRAPFQTARVSLKVGLGDEVTVGQVIAVLQADELNQVAAQQNLAVRRAEMTLDGLKRQQSGLPAARKQKVQAAELQVTQAKQALALAEQQGNPLAIDQAKAQVASANLALEAAKDQSDEALVAQQITSAELELTVARDQLKEVTAKQEQASVKATSAGTVLAVPVKEGQAVPQGVTLVEVGQLDVLVVRARVDEVDVVKVKPAMSLTLTANAHVGDRFDGMVKRVAPQASGGEMRQATGNGATTFDVQGEVQNPDRKLRPGMNTMVAIATESRANSLVIGVEALREEGDHVSVLVVQDFKVHVTPIKIGLRTETQVEVLSGVQEGDVLIVSPFTVVRSLPDGATVRTEMAVARQVEGGS